MRRSALVTGASRGIGRAIAAALAREGWPVCVNYLERRDTAGELVRELRDQGRAAMAVQADVSDREAVENMVRAASEELGPVELLVNNAGISHQGLFQDLDDGDWDRLLAVNLTGPRNAIGAVLPHMLSGKRGCIINVSSVWGLRGGSCETAYAVTKAGIIGLTRSLALELAPSGGDPVDAGGGDPPGTPGQAGGHRGGGGLPGLGKGGVHHRAGADSRRRVYRLRKKRHPGGGPEGGPL